MFNKIEYWLLAIYLRKNKSTSQKQTKNQLKQLFHSAALRVIYQTIVWPFDQPTSQMPWTKHPHKLGFSSKLVDFSTLTLTYIDVAKNYNQLLPKYQKKKKRKRGSGREPVSCGTSNTIVYNPTQSYTTLYPKMYHDNPLILDSETKYSCVMVTIGYGILRY